MEYMVTAFGCFAIEIEAHSSTLKMTQTISASLEGSSLRLVLSFQARKSAGINTNSSPIESWIGCGGNTPVPTQEVEMDSSARLLRNTVNTCQYLCSIAVSPYRHSDGKPKMLPSN